MTPWIRDWVDALESGYFKQGMNPNNLWEPEGRYSALGVLCEINGCKREALDVDLMRETLKERLLKESRDTANIDLVVKVTMHRYANERTTYHYSYKNDKRTHEHYSYIPVKLTSKLDCNASLDLLNGVRNDIVMRIDGSRADPSVASLSNALVPFTVIAEFIRDVWPALTFKQSKKFTVDYKDYGYFKLERA